MLLVVTLSLFRFGIYRSPYGFSPKSSYQQAGSDEAVFENVTCVIHSYDYSTWIALTPGKLEYLDASICTGYGVIAVVDVYDPDGIDTVWIVGERRSDGLVVSEAFTWMQGNEPPPSGIWSPGSHKQQLLRWIPRQGTRHRRTGVFGSIQMTPTVKCRSPPSIASVCM